MSFLLKGVIRKVLDKYLNIHDEISLEKGYIHLASGHLNHHNINSIPALQLNNAKLLYSQYTGLTLSLPILEIMSKPISIKIDSIQIVLSIDQKSDTQALKQDKAKEPDEKKKEEKQEKEENNEGYFKGLVNRLLTNMELEVKELVITVRWHGEEQYRLKINNLTIKNSLSLLEANLLKKVICLGNLTILSCQICEEDQGSQIATTAQEIDVAKIDDLNMSVNIDHRKINLICLVGEVSSKLKADFIQKACKVATGKKDEGEMGEMGKNQSPKKEKKQSEQKKQDKQEKQMNKQLEDKLPKVENFELKINLVSLEIVPSKPSLTNISCFQIHYFELLHQKKRKSDSFISAAFERVSLSLLSNPHPLISLSSAATLQHPNNNKIKKIKNKVKIHTYLNARAHLSGLCIDNLLVELCWSDSLPKDLLLALKWAEKNRIQQILAASAKSEVKVGKKAKEHRVDEMEIKLRNTSIKVINPESNRKQNNKISYQNYVNTGFEISLSAPNELKASLLTEGSSGKVISLMINCDLIHVSVNNCNICEVESASFCLNMGVRDKLRDLIADNPEFEDNPPSLDEKRVGKSFSLPNHIFINNFDTLLKYDELIASVHHLEIMCPTFVLSLIPTIQRIVSESSPQIQKIAILLHMANKEEQVEIASPSMRKKEKRHEARMRMFIRIEDCCLSVGQTNNQKIYLPILLAKISNIKSFICLSNSPSGKVECSLKFVKAISPHTLTESTLIRNQVRVKVQKQEEHNNIIIKDSINVEIQEEHICLILGLIRSCQERARGNPNVSMFVTLTNDLHQLIILEEARDFGGKMGEGALINDKKEKIIVPLKPRQFKVESRQCQQVYLHSLSALQLTIKGEQSQQLPSLRDFCKERSEGLFEIPITFNYHEECRYMLQVLTHNRYHLQLRVKPKYELHILKGLEGEAIYRSLNSVEVRCGKFKKSARWEQGEENVLMMEWEMVEEDKLEDLQIRIEIEKRKYVYAVHRLMQNSIKYKLYGLILMEGNQDENSEEIENKAENEIKRENQTTRENVGRQNYQYYILEEATDHQQGTHKFHLMPFLVIKNNLKLSPISITIDNKKVSNSHSYELAPSSSLTPTGTHFDYYMKQYVIQLDMIPSSQDPTPYVSEEHYFNTFFMVDENFESLIELRSPKNEKKHLRIKESFILKTKVLSIEDALTFYNQTEYPLEISICKPTSEDSHSPLAYPLENYGTVTLAQKLKKDHLIRVIYLGSEQETHIDIPVGKLMENNGKVLLSYNFCLGRAGFKSEGRSEEFCQILIKMEISGGSGENNLNQEINFSPFLIFHNFCEPETYVLLNNTRIRSALSSQEKSSISLELPSSTNKEYNNRWLPLSPSNIEQIYDDLLSNREAWVRQPDNTFTKIEVRSLNNSIFLHLDELLTHKTVEESLQVFSLVRSICNDCIELYLSNRIINPTSANRYFLFHNSTNQHFLMNPPETGYGKYLLQNSEKSGEMNESDDEWHWSQKVQMSGERQKPAMMLNKDKYEIFLCDREYMHLESLSTQKLEKLRIRQEKCEIQNFTLLNFYHNSSATETSTTSPNTQIITSSISLKLFLSNKDLSLQADLKSLSVRIFENEKADCLVKDVSVGVGREEQGKLQLHQVLRIPEESYLLLQMGIFGDKTILIRNIFLKCKIIDAHVHQHLLKFIGTFTRFLKALGNNQEEVPPSNSKREGEGKIRKLAQEPFLIIKTFCIHSINMCLTVKTNPSMDFSNMITIPQFSMSNKCCRPGFFLKEISNHYVTNIIGKFPKLSFIYHNIRSPLVMIKSILEIKDNFTDDQKEDSRKFRAAVMASFVDFSGARAERKKREDVLTQNERISRFLLKSEFIAKPDQEVSEALLGTIKNVISCNISKLNQISNLRAPLIYYLTNLRLCLYSKDLPLDSISLKEIHSVKVSRFGNHNAELTVLFRKTGGQLKVLDEFSACQHLVGILKSLII